MKNNTFEEIQSKLKETLAMAEVKIGTKKADLLERVYIKALRDNGIGIPPVVDILLFSGRSVAGFISSKD
jgi:hypothetical protein